MSRLFTLIFISIALFSCNGLKKEKVDLLIRNATIYTVDQNFSTGEAMAIRNDTIVAVGTEHEILNKYQSENVVDARKQFIYPGFNDGHAHFVGYAENLTKVNLVGTQSWQECLERVKKYAAQHPEGWILGRGWDQNDWEESVFPHKISLDSLFPDQPVLLKRIDGHAAIANSAALELATISTNTRIQGGKIEILNNEVTGILIDNAVDLVEKRVPTATAQQKTNGLLKAQNNCFAMGITSLTDAGLPVSDILLLDSLQQNGPLKMRIYAMVSDDSAHLAYFQQRGKIKTDYLNVRSFKVYADGALGSRGAALLEPYHDAKNQHGFLLNSPEHFTEMAQKMKKMDFQMNVHCIGDSTNRLLLDIMGLVLGGVNDLRWRIEHAQVVHPADVQKFRDYTILPSVQPTHATSDAPWAELRLGDRIKNAYIFNDLLQQNGTIVLGTDFPVEDISPIKTFYSAVFRKPLHDDSAVAFQPQNALSREDALRGITIWPALATFEENEKGSLEVGKLADFVILNSDLLKISEQQFSTLEIMATYSGGRLVYQQ